MTTLNPIVSTAARIAIASAAQASGATPVTAENIAEAAVGHLASNSVVLNETNSEPWYQSRVTWGALLAIAAPLAGLVLGHTVTPEDQVQLATLLASAGGAVGGFIAFWGRWVSAKPPLGG